MPLETKAVQSPGAGVTGPLVWLLGTKCGSPSRAGSPLEPHHISLGPHVVLKMPLAFSFLSFSAPCFWFIGGISPTPELKRETRRRTQVLEVTCLPPHTHTHTPQALGGCSLSRSPREAAGRQTSSLYRHICPHLSTSPPFPLRPPPGSRGFPTPLSLEVWLIPLWGCS